MAAICVLMMPVKRLRLFSTLFERLMAIFLMNDFLGTRANIIWTQPVLTVATVVIVDNSFHYLGRHAPDVISLFCLKLRSYFYYPLFRAHV